MSEISLCCFAHAGGSARGYASFKRLLDPSVIPVPMEIAGRGGRLAEPRFTDAEKCAEDIFQKNREVFEKGSYALFGHSLGSIIAYETARIIKKNGLPGPKHIFFSGRPAIHSRDIAAIDGISELSDEEFIKAFQMFGGLPDVVVNNPDMLAMILPILRDDVVMADKHRPVVTYPELNCNISVLYGCKDQIYSGQDLEMWQECTTGKCGSLGFDGDHFYFNEPENKAKLCKYISDVLTADI